VTPGEHLAMARLMLRRQKYDRAQVHYLAAFVEAVAADEEWPVPAAEEEVSSP
jgi:hypothetical protein